MMKRHIAARRNELPAIKADLRVGLAGVARTIERGKKLLAAPTPP